MKRVIKKQAFTLVEIIAVLVIIGIMAAVAAPKFVSMAAEARNKAALAGVAEAKASLAVAYAKAYLSNSGQPTRAQVYTASGMAAGDVTFGDVVVTLADHANGDDVTVTTKSAFCAGCMSKFSVTGTLPRELVADKYNSYTDIKIFGSSVKNDNVALCNPESPVKCPSPAGTYTWDFEMEFPSLGFSYDAEAKNVWKATDDASDVLLCIDMTAHIA